MVQKIPKAIERRAQDMLDYHHCLSDDVKAYLSGNTSRLKTILCVLRVLVCDEGGLVFEIDKDWQIGPGLIIRGLPHLPPTNPRSKDKAVSLADYMQLPEYGCMPMAGIQMSNRELIKGYADQDGSHSDPGAEPHIHSKENILIGGMPALDWHVLGVAKNVSVAIEAMIQAAIKKDLVIEAENR